MRVPAKTIMTGLYIQELLLRQQVKRVLVVPPAGTDWQLGTRITGLLSTPIPHSVQR